MGLIPVEGAAQTLGYANPRRPADLVNFGTVQSPGWDRRGLSQIVFNLWVEVGVVAENFNNVIDRHLFAAADVIRAWFAVCAQGQGFGQIVNVGGIT